jgi:AmmeMemoRadiSam system protein B
MASLDRPQLRPLSGRRFEREGRSFVALEDPLGVFPHAILVPLEGFHLIVRRFDGQTTLREIQARVFQETGQWIAAHEIESLVEQLDRALVLDGPTFAAFCDNYRRQRIRPAALAGRSYAGTEKALRAQLAQYFTHERGAGPPRPSGAVAPGRLRGVLSPHIDFHRGGPTYTWSYKEIVERSDANTFVIFGVAHQYCRNRFALTRKDFETPLGVVRTDRPYVDRIAALAGEHFFDDELAHRNEHSIEFQVVFLQYLLGGRREFAIVPILVGPFHDLMTASRDPIADGEVRRFIEALRAAEAASGQKVAYIGGIDLSHVGPEFGDPHLLDPDTLDQVRRFDSGMLDRATAVDPSGWFGQAAAVGNRWRVCGLAATYTMLHVLGPTRGRLLHYDQAVDAERTCCVSFASVAFDTITEDESTTDAAWPDL